MYIRLALSCATLLIAYVGVAASQTPTAIAVPEAKLEPQIYKTPGAEGTWRRPPEVRFILLSGCGGGGGGLPQRSLEGTAGTVRAAGGGAAPVATLVLAVSSDTYKFRVANPGQDTVFEGSDQPKIVFRAGIAGRSPTFDGETSPYGAGGTGGRVAQAGNACAGGGAIDGVQNGAAGGGGYLVIHPLPDIARFARVLATIEQLSAEPKETPATR